MLAGDLVFAEIVHREQTRVRAALTANGLVRGAERRKLVEREHRGLHGAAAAHAKRVLAVSVAREQRCAVRAHVARDVGTHRIDLGKLFERTQDGVVQERSALHDDLASHIMGIADLDDLEQRVLDDRDGEARSDIAYRRTFLLRLLHAAVHEHGAAAAEIDGVFGLDGRACELRHIEVQTRREAFDEAAAARRARLVEHDVVDHAVLHAQAFHILTADIEDELDAGKHLLGTAQVRDRLDLARVNAQRLEQQTFAVSRHGRVADAHGRLPRLGIDGQRVVHVGKRRLGASEHISLVARIVRPQKAAVFSDERRLERGRTRIDAEIGHALVRHEIAAAHALVAVALFELVVIVGAREQGSEAHHFGTLDIAEALQTIDHLAEPLGFSLVARYGAARSNEQMGVVGNDDMLLVEAERLVEALAQLGKVLQRTAEKRDVAADRTAARKARDGLRHNRLEDRGRDILFAGALVQKRLHVGFGEHATAACNGVDRRMVLRKLVQTARIGIEKRRHLIDERAGSARACSVHALLDALIEVDDLCIFAAEFDGHVCFRDEDLYRRLTGDDLLHELDVEPLSQEQTARTGDGDGHRLVAVFLRSLFEHLDDRGAHVGVMTAVQGIADGVLAIENRQLDGGRPHIDADVQDFVFLVYGLGGHDFLLRLLIFIVTT